MQHIIITAKSFTADDSGATALEYGLIAGLISLAVVTGATAAGTAVNTIFTAIGTKLAAAATAITAA